MSARKQGALGVAKAILHYTELGYAVFTPVSDVSRFDLIIEKDGTLLRVEVKTTSVASGETSLRTHGGNQSWSGVTKRISEEDCDIVFIMNVVTGNFAEFRSKELAGRSSITVK